MRDRRILLRVRGRGSWPEPGDPLIGRQRHDLLRIADRAAADAQALERSSFAIRVDVDAPGVDEAADAVLTETRWLGPHER